MTVRSGIINISQNMVVHDSFQFNRVKQDDFKFAPGDLICLHSLLFTVKNKFGLPDVALLDIFDDTDTAVEEDILELLEANPDMCLTVRDSISNEGRCH